MMPLPILATKLYIPTPRAEFVKRPFLLNRLNDGLQHHKMTLISAPAGFGKTSLAAEWVAQVTHAVAWLSLDSAEREPTRFLTYLIAAVQNAIPDIGAELLETIQSSQTVPPEYIVTVFINRIAATDNKLLLVLDDYHLLDAKPIDTILSFLLDYLPPNMHLVLVTREDPPLPLARLRAQKQMTEIRVRDLRFAVEETAVFLTQTMRLPLTEKDIVILESRTEGWITGLQLAALALQQKSVSTNQDARRKQFIQDFNGSQQYVLDYLIEEILQQQPEQVRLFLMHTSILERLNGQICDAVTEQKNSADRLESLERNNMFLIPLDEQRQWYRYHHLFADALQANLAKTAPDLLPKLHQRASHWHEQHGQKTAAIEHAIKGQQFAHAAALIEQAWPTVQLSFEYTTFALWARALPEAIVASRPVLSMALGWALTFNGELQRANKWLTIADNWLKGHKKGEMVVTNETEFHYLPATLMTARMIHAQTSGQPIETITYGNQALALLPADDALDNHFRRATPAGILSLAYWTIGDLNAAYKHVLDAWSEMRQTSDVSNTIGLTPLMTYLAFSRGQLRQAIRTAEDGLKQATGERHYPIQGLIDLYLAAVEMYLEQYDLERATQYWEKKESIPYHSIYGVNKYRIRLIQARLKQAEGDLNGAQSLLDKAEELYKPTVIPNLQPIPAIKARLWLRQNQLDKAVDWVYVRGLSASDELHYLQEYEHLTLIRVLIAQYRTEGGDATINKAISLLNRLQQQAEANQRIYALIDIFILQALAAQAQRNLDKAVAHLEHALTLAKPDEYIKIFVDEGQPLDQLLELVHRRGIYTSFVGQILAAFEAPSLNQTEDSQQIATTQVSQLLEDLSERELDVLRLLKTELSGPEIARELVVALSTVRTHTKGIYRKLDVNNRRAAVKRAEELNLV